ncbi:MAG: hypothetical protein KDB53_03205, partial [Planctomycetes bacterium]|nr:hypothetical protein [Planctomycetota bacterium]
ADKVMSVIISTAQNKDSFPPSALAAGANGAYAARGKDQFKALEAIRLYQNVLANLGQVKDADERAILGREAWFRIGNCYAELGRNLEAAAAFEKGYRQYNNDKLSPEQSEQKTNERLYTNWRAVLSSLRKDHGDEALYRQLYDEMQTYIIENPPVGAAVSVDGLAWQKAENLRRAKEYDEAIRLFEELSKRPGEYQEKAMVKLAEIRYIILYDNRGKSVAADWIKVGKAFEDYLAFVNRTPESDPTKAAARKDAVLLARLYYGDAMTNAAEAATEASATEAEQRELWQKVITATEGYADTTKNQDLRNRSRLNRFLALVALKRLADAESVFDALRNEDPNSKEVRAAGLKMGGILKEKAEAMPARTEEQIAARNAVFRRSADAYRGWLEAKDSDNVSYWAMVYNLYYDTGSWAEAHDLLTRAIVKFENKPKDAKFVTIMKRKKARCTLELARLAYADGDEEKCLQLFHQAEPVYAELVGPDNKAPATILEEAAQVFGGFLAGPDRRGNYTFFKGNGEFLRAAKMWDLVESYQTRKMGKADITDAERRELNFSYEQAKFYKILTFWKNAQADGDPKTLRKVKTNVDALFMKTKGKPGDPWFTAQYQWLQNQL